MSPAAIDDIDEQEPEEKLAARRALLRLELHAQHRILRDVPVDPVLGFLETKPFESRAAL